MTGGQTLSSWYVAVSRHLDFAYHSNWHDLYKSTVLSFRFLSYRQEKICREGSAIQLAWKCAQTVSTHLLSNRFVSERSEGVVWFFLFRKKHVNSSKLDTAWPTQQSKSNGTIVSHNWSNVPHSVYGSQTLQPVSTSTLRSAKCLIKFSVRFFSCTQCRIRRPGKGTCPNGQPQAVLTAHGELKAFGSALGLRFCCLNHSISTWITHMAGKASELSRELIALAHLTWNTEHQSCQNGILWIHFWIHHKLLKIERVNSIDHSIDLLWYILVSETTPCLKCPLAWICWHKNIWCLCHLKHGEHHSWMSTLLCWIWCLSSRTSVFFGQTWHLGSHAVACHCHTQGVHSVHCAHSRHSSHVEDWDSLPDLSTTSSAKTSTMTSWTAIFHWLRLAVNILKILTHFCNLWTLWTGWLRWRWGTLRLDRLCLCL